MREALEPFAREADKIDAIPFNDQWRDGTLLRRITISVDFDLTVGDLRRARQALDGAMPKKVRKRKGYKFEGVCVATFQTLAGKTRHVVDNGDGLLHIFSPEQLDFVIDGVRENGGCPEMDGTDGH